MFNILLNSSKFMVDPTPSPWKSSSTLPFQPACSAAVASKEVSRLLVYCERRLKVARCSSKFSRWGMEE